jgi:hypothetical protein
VYCTKTFFATKNIADFCSLKYCLNRHETNFPGCDVFMQYISFVAVNVLSHLQFLFKKIRLKGGLT